MRILVTGANAPGTSGTVYSMNHSDFQSNPLALYGSDEFPLRHNPLFEKVTQLPNGGDQNYEYALEQFCREERIDLVIPQTTSENSYFTETLSKKRDFAISVLKSTKSTINLNSKIQTYKFISKLNVAREDFRICETFDQLVAFQEANHRTNFFLKADELSGGRGIVKVVPDISKTVLEKARSFHVVGPEGLQEVFNVLNNGNGVVAQLEAIGKEFSIDCYRDENLIISVPRTRDLVRAGISQQTTVTQQKVLSDFASRFGEELGLEGIFGLQCIVTEPNGFSFLECNPRIQGTMVASTIAGENIIARGARLALGMPQIPLQPISWGTVYRRTWSGFGYSEDNVYEI